MFQWITRIYDGPSVTPAGVPAQFAWLENSLDVTCRPRLARVACRYDRSRRLPRSNSRCMAAMLPGLHYGALVTRPALPRSAAEGGRLRTHALSGRASASLR